MIDPEDQISCFTNLKQHREKWNYKEGVVFNQAGGGVGEERGNY